jgi:hypothetical protein
MKTFDIREHLDKLEPNEKEKGKYICPVCGGNDLAVATAGDPPAYNCFSNGCEPKDIRNLIAPLAKGQRPAKTEKRRNADATRKANAVENKVTNLVMLITLEEISLEQAQVELSAWCQEHGHDRFAAGQLLRAKAKNSVSVSKNGTDSQYPADNAKPLQGKDSDRSVSKSVKSKGDNSTESPEPLITDQEWARFAQTMKTPGNFDPFHWLPEDLARIARSDAARNSVDPMAIWGYLLPAVMSMMGADTKLDMSGWKVPNIIWSLVIAESGMGKSRAKELVVGPIEELNAQEFENWQLRVEDWQRQERARAKDKSDDNEPNPKPTCRRWAISHSTPEGMIKRLKDQDGHGVLAYRDEFAGWVKGLTQYNPKGNGMEVLLETWDGGSILVDRVNEDDSFLVKSSRLSLVGGIQPGMFAKVFETAEDSQGILARFMALLPTEFPYRRYRGISLLPGVLSKMYKFLNDTDWGIITPTPEADDLFTEVAENFMNQKAPTKNAQPWMRKLAGQTLRLAMAIHAIECYYDRSKRPQTLTADTMARAYHMAEHYKKHFFHVMGIAASDGLEGVLAKIQSVACCNGDGVSTRDIARGPAGSRVKALAQSEGMRPADFCLKLFEELASNGWGEVCETVLPNGRKRVTYHALESHCSESTDTLTEDPQPIEHQGLRIVSEVLTHDDTATDTSLKDTRNQGFQGFEPNQDFVDTSVSTNGHHPESPPDYSGLTPDRREEDFGFEEF